MTERHRQRRVHLVSLGCSKALVDSEVVLGQLARRGWELTDDDEAELYLINTCGFLPEALEETRVELERLASLRDRFGGSRLAVIGCAVEELRERLLDEYPAIDLLAGTGALPRLGELVDGLFGGLAEKTAGAPVVSFGEPGGAYDGNPDVLPQRIALTPPHTAYLKLAEGCDLGCAFCAIPRLRGPQRSRELEAVVGEAAGLVQAGARELILIAQETTAYGRDLYGEPSLAHLLGELALNLPVDDLWLRVLYPNPARVDEAFLGALDAQPQFVPYLDFPFQHADAGVLRAMNREGGPAELRATIEAARELVPDLVLRGTALVGFPGEDAAAFDELVRFVDEVRFDHLGVFAYAAMPGTPAAALDDDVTPAEKELRRRALYELQEAVSLEKNSALVGREDRVLVDFIAEEGAVCRAARHCPEVDGFVEVTLPRGHDWLPGEFRRIIYTEALPYDLRAEPAADEPPTEA